MQFPEPSYDPVIGNYFKRIHAASYQEVMDREADKALFKAGIIPEHVHEHEDTTK